MKELLKALAARNRILAKCIAIAVYITGYQNLQKELDTFVEAGKRTDRRYIRRLMLDIYFSELYYHIAVEEYFWFQFYGKTDEERRAYLGNFEKNELCAEIGDAKCKRTLADKYECYVYFRGFYGRDVIKVSCQEDRAVFEEFLSKHKEFIVKPIDQSGGNGIYRISVENMNSSEYFQKVLDSGPCVVEQCIEQVHEMAQFHPQSVNTIRISTFYNDSGIKILYSILRTGTGCSIVDNTGAGGIFSSIDIATGRIQSDGYLENGTIYKTHPDTNCIFNGFQIPHWSDLLDIATKAALAFPQYNYISWDFALTYSGWVMVEANPRGELGACQIFLGGVREFFIKEVRENNRGMKNDI